MKIYNILLVNPPYEPIGVKESVSSASVTLSLAMLAGVAKARNIDVHILDLNTSSNWQNDLRLSLEKYKPNLVGVTFATPLVKIASYIANEVRLRFGSSVMIIGGGPHASAKPIEFLQHSDYDAVAIGEAEKSFDDFLVHGSFEHIPGWVYKIGEQIISNQPMPLIKNLDDLPFAAVELFDTTQYIYPADASRENPVCLLETSRGCYAYCIYCNKNIFGHKIRRKSSKRVVDEMQYILGCGFREIHFADDSFTADLNHAKGVCNEIINRGLSFPWVPRSGIRVDRVTPDLLNLMRKAGCYHTPFGIESGSQEVLDRMKKGITVDQVIRAVQMSKDAGMETTGYFMFGLPGETKDTIMKTIEFALQLRLDHIKFGVAIPLPGTEFFELLDQEGLLKTNDWEKFTYSTPPWELYHHPSLDRDTLEQITINQERLMDVANRSIHFTRSSTA